jgi:GT2 family glycosyltransferase
MGYPERISVIILAHNNIPMTLHCLQSLSGAVCDLDHEIILLDNGSTQDTKVVRECASLFRRFEVVRSEANLSFSAGNNRCAGKVSGRWLLFLNNDVFAGGESVKGLLSPFLEKSGIGATGGKLLFPGESAVQHAGIGQMLWDHPSNYGVGARPDDPRIQESRDCFALTGAMLCVAREVFETVGGFDERYVWGTEDIDLCLKISTAGWKTMYCPDAAAVHCESATLKGSGKCESERNCGLYRQLWDAVLRPAEEKYVEFLKRSRVRHVAVFGMGTAARGLARILQRNGIEIVAFTSSDVTNTDGTFLDRPVLPLDLLPAVDYDRLMVASQYFFGVESAIQRFDPRQDPLYPLLN